jgi:hypothetical protein
MSLTSLITTAAETTATHGGVNHWVVGGVALALLLVLMLALLAFGAGRDHS